MVGCGEANDDVPKAEVGFAVSEELGVAGAKDDEPKEEGLWLANAPNAPVAGLRTLVEPPDGVVLSGPEPLWVVGVANVPNILGLGVFEAVLSVDPPNESPPNPPPPVSTTADMGSSELDIDMAIGEGGAGLPDGCAVAGGARLLEPKPNFEGPADANAPNPPGVDCCAGVEDVLPKVDD